MKKTAIAIAAMLLVSAACFSAKAEGFLIKGGLNYSHLDLTQSIKDQAKALALDPGNYTGFHVGVGYQSESALGFCLQPELRWSKKGGKFGQDIKWSMSYLELPVNIQWGLDLIAIRPFVQLSPYIGYSLKNSVTGTNKSLSEQVSKFLNSLSADADRFAYGLGIGGGIELMRKIQITAQYVWNFGQVSSFNDYMSSAANVSRDTAGALEISLGLLF